MNTTPGNDPNPSPSSAETEQEIALRSVAEAVDRVNEAILYAVDAGVSVELVRSSRCHDGRRNWGDQMTLNIPGSIADRILDLPQSISR
jgi:hypothetical protein